MSDWTININVRLNNSCKLSQIHLVNPNITARTTLSIERIS